MGRKTCWQIKGTNNLTLKVFQIYEWRSNQRKLTNIENPKMGGKNKEGNKTYGRNNGWESQMPFTHPLT